jgi:hypothetical protein
MSSLLRRLRYHADPLSGVAPASHHPWGGDIPAHWLSRAYVGWNYGRAVGPLTTRSFSPLNLGGGHPQEVMTSARGCLSLNLEGLHRGNPFGWPLL